MDNLTTIVQNFHRYFFFPVDYYANPTNCLSKLVSIIFSTFNHFFSRFKPIFSFSTLHMLIKNFSLLYKYMFQCMFLTISAPKPCLFSNKHVIPKYLQSFVPPRLTDTTTLIIDAILNNNSFWSVLKTFHFGEWNKSHHICYRFIAGFVNSL